MQAYLICCTKVLLNEIVTLRLTQRDVAITLSMALRSEAAGYDTIDWEAVADAAVTRWSPAGWRRLKERAYGMAQRQVRGEGVNLTS